MANLTLPTIHFNGTSREALLEEYQTAWSAVQQALEAVIAAAPNDRDYYVQGPEACTRAQAEHRERLAKIESVMTELHQILMHVFDQAPDARLRGVR